MTNEQWEKAPEVEAVGCYCSDHMSAGIPCPGPCPNAPQRRTDPAPPAWEEVTEVSCIICGVKDGGHDAACPRQEAIAP